jgi:hypothetical protein
MESSRIGIVDVILYVLIGIGMGVCLQLGLALTLFHKVQPYTPGVSDPVIETLVRGIQSVFGPNFVQWLFPMMPLTLGAAQLQFTTGAFVLAIPPIGQRQWAISVIQVTLGLRGLVPAAFLIVGRQLNVAEEVALTLVLSVLGLTVLHKLKALGQPLLKSLRIIFWPFRWGKVWKNHYGTALISTVGVELLGCGYALAGHVPWLTWMLILLGALFLMNFSWREAHVDPTNKVRTTFGWLWFILNTEYLVVSVTLCSLGAAEYFGILSRSPGL